MTPLLLSYALEDQAALLEELPRAFPWHRIRVHSPGWVEVTCREPMLGSEVLPPAPAVVFARQVLPDVEVLEAGSISQWAKILGPRIAAALESRGSESTPWRLHVWCLDLARGPVTAARCLLVQDALLAWLKEHRRRLLKVLVQNQHVPLLPEESVVQVVLEMPDRGWLSVATPALCAQLRHSLSRFPGGKAPITEDRQAPSSAYRKLLEAQAQLGLAIQPGDSCVDLGGSPGGWSYIALARGALVVAVDRSPLRADLMTHAHLRFVKGDAFRFEPDAPVDWLLCDVIAFPERSLELLETWLERGWCRRFVVTLKFRGREDYSLLEKVKILLRRRAKHWMLRRLEHNRNEVTAMGQLPGQDVDATPTPH